MSRAYVVRSLGRVDTRRSPTTPESARVTSASATTSADAVASSTIPTLIYADLSDYAPETLREREVISWNARHKSTLPPLETAGGLRWSPLGVLMHCTRSSRSGKPLWKRSN